MRPLIAEWEYDGMLCVAANTDTGAMWECPLLLELQELPDVLRPLGLGRRGCSSLRSRSESFRSEPPNACARCPRMAITAAF
jgi:sucrose-6-phosphate hydrolase SacC (GH32 family)